MDAKPSTAYRGTAAAISSMRILQPDDRGLQASEVPRHLGQQFRQGVGGRFVGPLHEPVELFRLVSDHARQATQRLDHDLLALLDPLEPFAVGHGSLGFLGAPL